MKDRAVARIPHVDRMILSRDLEKTALLFPRFPVVDTSSRNGEHDVVVIEAVARTLAMQSICHARPNPKLVFPRTNEYPSPARRTSNALSPSPPHRVETPTAT